MKFVKGLFGGSKPPASRQLEHARDLAVGDMIRLNDSYALPAQIRDKVFRVIGVNTYQFEHSFDTSFSLESDSNDRIDLMIEREDGRERACISITITREDVESLFDLEQFAAIFDDDEAVTLNRRSEDGFEGWVAEAYDQQAKGQTGYYHEGIDHRAGRPSSREDDSQPFEYYELVSGDRTRGVDIEVWEDGETDVALSLYRPIEDIKELWPGTSPG